MRKLWLAALVLAFASLSSIALGLPFKALRARLAIVDLDFVEAAGILGEDDDPEVTIERARLHIYQGDCDAALALLERPDLDEVEEHPLLLEVAKGCARSTAATLIERDEKAGVLVRFQDDEDRALFPILVETATQIRDMLHKELGTRLPDPVFIDLLRDQFALAAHSGLPEEAAQTTGTVAVAKWGRVLMISPRAAPRGYPWLDTLAHEMTHLVLSQATRDRAPLWLQEGVAKRQEIRWREAHPFDGQPSADAVAWFGIQKSLALPLDGLGPSIAMLPSPEQATIAFAEVASFIQFWVRENGPEALPKLLAELRNMGPDKTASDAIATVSGKSLAEWDDLWRGYLTKETPSLAPEHRPGVPPPKAPEAARRRRLGQLLLERGHPAQARGELAAAHALVPTDAELRCLYSDALRGVGEEVAAADLFARPDDVSMPGGRWWSLHEMFEMGSALPHARDLAIGQDPLSPPIPCLEHEEGDYPTDPKLRALCEAAWRMPESRLGPPGPSP
ncbi:MAG: hypothetical protein R3B72_26110 [Polyangiaceae bacterium]